uniref:Kinesin-like protein KIF15-like n=1 Tax=Saccoglossus kowalevskii TaxID=10224 RepID=A0ABM0MXK1_SACKO|nr:PREDICTED: kinesin-like protein KIF15-like [Saccoglossus kowalevskii]
MKAGVANIKTSQLHLVDLAGSERQKDSKAEGMRLKEAGSINRSLSALGNVIMALVDIAHGKTRHVPYRDSKLSFLLRDSLGGNSKTYIIACVHPGIGCFGETLSTLHFARRAKMIKNKARVNEDTHGNVTHLQAEIKRLKDELYKFQSGALVPMQSALSPSAHAGHGRLERQWKKQFLDAMYLREKLDTERQTLMQRVARLEDYCDKKEKFLQSSKMIIKFREHTILQLERVQKKDLAIEDSSDLIIKNLKNEIKELNEKIEHHPGITKYAMENQNLRAEIKRLQQLESISNISQYEQDRVQQLEQCYKQLVSENEVADRPGSVTPNTTPQPGDKVSLATLERCKMQIKNLQAALETTKQGFAEQEELARQKRIDMEAENTSLKKTVSELENVVAAMQVKNKMEMDHINNIHAETIKTITTPKRAGNRSRLVMVGMKSESGLESPLCTNTSNGDVEENPDAEEEGIDDIAMPEEMEQQKCEALADEIKRLEDKCSNLLEQLHQEQASNVKIKQDNCKLELQHQQFSEMLSTNRNNWSSKEHDLNQNISTLTAQLEILNGDHDILQSEVEDLRILLNSADRQIEEEKQIKQAVQLEHNEEKACLREKVLRIESEMFELQKQIDDLREERDVCQNQYQTSEMEKQLQGKQLEDLTTQLDKEKEQVKQLESHMQLLLEKLETEVEKCVALKAQLKQEDKEKELLKALDDNQSLKSQNVDLASQCQQLRENLSKLQSEKDALNLTVSSLVKRAVSDKEAISSLTTTIQDLRCTVTDRDNNIATLSSELNDAISQCESLQQTNEEITTLTKKLEEEIHKKNELFMTQAAKHDVEIELMKDELEESMDQCQSLTAELDKQTTLLQLTHGEKEVLATNITELNLKIKEMEEEKNKLVVDFEEKIKDAEANNSTIVVETQNDDLLKTIDDQRNEITHLKLAQNQMAKIFEDFEHGRVEKNEEIRNLKHQLTEFDYIKAENEMLSTKHQTLGCEFEYYKDKVEEREARMKQQLDSAKIELERSNAAYYSANEIRDETIESKLRLEAEIAKMSVNMEILLDSNKEISEELERIQQLEITHFQEKENYRSQLEETMEEKTKLMKDIKKIEEKNEELAAQNAKLIGHQNLKQKIQYHLQIKKENNQLREQMAQIKAAHARTVKELEQYKKNVDGQSFEKSRKHDTNCSGLKENLDPSNQN